ncbi:hypothetical protein [Nonomuraea sp. NPDC049695]|uniref:hypothetical protein n=1 Tax=Nonomuraea sp. NPDC049695 TaxID=3154734 RepID=UPI0034196398
MQLAALGNSGLTAAELREIAIFLAHDIGRLLGAELGVQIETLISAHEKRSGSSRSRPDP